MKDKVEMKSKYSNSNNDNVMVRLRKAFNSLFSLQLVRHNKDVALLALTFWAQRVQEEQYAAIPIWESRVGKLDFTKIIE